MKISRIDQITKPRFRIAVHVLAWLSHSGGVLSSSAIAGQVNSHATFLRRILALLSRSEIVEAKEGRDGGYFLIIPPEQITLADIYLAIEDERESDNKDDLDCGEAGRQLDLKLEALMAKAEQQLIDYLSQFTLSDVMAEIDFDKSLPE
ncbi:Rrf2 family transcriptional regulator [Paenibacillus sp. J2TS4]|uniref:Rrf2 family transcriptional regulator n=1 Tax=Paenibacillus sp. J2TS4 TaxID=2807194 RepID=UPI001B043264|nr:Rrf2 family transcriptional regulator [Paenibacillus sp. J2TS4]GIP34486.1 hypothetical protein J2TS4_36960 [Paenibacillus sp. J2TS4]